MSSSEIGLGAFLGVVGVVICLSLWGFGFDDGKDRVFSDIGKYGCDAVLKARGAK